MIKFFLIIYGLFFFPIFTFASLQVFPLRVTMSDKIRNAQISVRHQGTSTTRYRIKTLFYKMMPDGSMKEVSDDEVASESASKLIRFSPKEVTLEPKVEQIVRLTARLPSELPDGEYRTHLHFEEMDNVDSPTIESRGTDGAQLFLKAHLALAIPVVIKKGSTSSKIKLENLKIVTMPDKKIGYSFELTRIGNSFIYGDIEVESIDLNGKSTIIGSVNGVSSYIEKRNITYPLSIEKVPPGKLRINFKQNISENNTSSEIIELEVK